MVARMIRVFTIVFLIIYLIFAKVATAENKCIMINNIILDNSKKFELSIKKIKKEHEGRCLKTEDIKLLIRKITNLYIDLGYITTRVLLPEQDLSSGKLHLKIIEGHISKIDIKGDHKLISPFLPIRTNKILSLRDIEQSYDQYSRASSNDIKIELKPGDQPGATKMLISNNPKRKWHVKTGVDNSGSKQKGELLSFTNFTVNNFLNLNELYMFNFRSSLEDPAERYTNSKSFYLSVPFDYNDINYSYNLSKSRNLIHSKGNQYTNSGVSKIFKIDFNRVIHRNGSGKTILSFGLGKDIYSNFLDQSKIQISSYKLDKYDLGVSFQRKLSKSILSYGASVTTGINKGFFSKFGNIAAPSREFTKINMHASWFTPLPIILAERNMQFRTSFSGQHTPDRLASSEKFSLGGLNSIRGFKEYNENADNALMLRNELIAPLHLKSLDGMHKFLGEFSIFTSFDIGHFSNYEEFGERRGTMSGVAAGIRNSNGLFNFDITIARALDAPINYLHKNILHFSVGLNI
jgi:hemolysin activation/secretion protein